jgi:hypothetical protein
LRDIEWAADSVRDSVSDAEDALGELLAFTKSFDQAEFSTIYCEREWRAVKDFDFKYSDLAMIVLPKMADSRSYLGEFVETAIRMGIPRSVPIVAYEDLLEY